MESDALFYVMRGIACYNNANFSSAVNEFSRAIEVEPGSVGALVYRALANFECGDPDDSWADLKSVVNTDPESGYAFFAKALVLRDQRLGEKCQGLPVTLSDVSELLSQAIELAPDFTPPYFYRGELRYYEGNLSGALEDLDCAIDLDPSYAQAYVRRAEVRAKVGDLRRAIKDLEYYLELPMGATWNSRVMQNISAYWYQLSVQAEQRSRGSAMATVAA